jgi:SAM-dependent methyltransferase
MPVPWIVDTDATLVLWRELSAMPLRLVDRPGGWVADLGGGNGNFIRPLTAKSARPVSVDPDREALLGAPMRGVRPVRGSALNLPIRDGSLDALAGRAVLHHVPDDLDDTMREVRRVVRPGGLVLFQEPTSGNAIANLARRWFPTERHDPDERPLPFDAYMDAVRRHFEALEATPWFLLSYLVPHVVARLPPDRRRAGRALARVLFAWDRRLLAALPGLRRRAAYVSIFARRPM